MRVLEPSVDIFQCQKINYNYQMLSKIKLVHWDANFLENVYMFQHAILKF